MDNFSNISVTNDKQKSCKNWTKRDTFGDNRKLRHKLDHCLRICRLFSVSRLLLCSLSFGNLSINDGINESPRYALKKNRKIITKLWLGTKMKFLEFPSSLLPSLLFHSFLATQLQSATTENVFSHRFDFFTNKKYLNSKMVSSSCLA